MAAAWLNLWTPARSIRFQLSGFAASEMEIKSATNTMPLPPICHADRSLPSQGYVLTFHKNQKPKVLMLHISSYYFSIIDTPTSMSLNYIEHYMKCFITYFIELHKDMSLVLWRFLSSWVKATRSKRKLLLNRGSTGSIVLSLSAAVLEVKVYFQRGLFAFPWHISVVVGTQATCSAVTVLEQVRPAPE